MAQPTKLPEWNTGLSNNVEPSSGEKIAGFATNATPTSSKLNWWMETVYQWANYLKNLVDEALTWTVRQTFSAGLDVAATGGATTITAIGLVGSTFQNNSGVQPTLELENAGAGPCLWLSSGGGNIADVADVTGHLDFDSAGDPGSQTSYANKVTKKNLLKAYAKVELNTSATPTLRDGFNLAAASPLTVGSNILTVAIGADMSAAHYLTVVTLGDETTTTLYHARVIATATGAVTIRLHDSAGTVVDPASAGVNGLSIYVAVFGLQ